MNTKIPQELLVGEAEAMSMQELIRSLLLASSSTVVPVLILHNSDRMNPTTAISEGRFAYAKPGAYEPLVVEGIPVVALFVDQELADMSEVEDADFEDGDA